VYCLKSIMALNSFIVCSSLNKKVLIPAYTAIRRLMIVSECVTEQSCSEFVQEWLCGSNVALFYSIWIQRAHLQL